MPELKPLSKEAIPAALEKAVRYRLLNEPAEAESICLDVLQADPDNQEAIVTLLLALTDRFEKGYGVSDTQGKNCCRESNRNTNAPITPELWPSAAPKLSWRKIRRTAASKLMTFSGKR
jgi:hypothetical protein